MNSYTVPLNPQEKRHATHQGDFKWFIVEMVEKYAESLKKLGVFTERNLSRMADAALLSDIVYTLCHGIKSASERNLDKFYEENDNAFPQDLEMHDRISAAMDHIIQWPDIHKSALMKSYNFYSLVLALSHALKPVEGNNLNEFYPRSSPLQIDPQFALPNLTLLSDAVDQPSAHPHLSEYIEACAKATTRIEQRRKRFIWLSKALEPTLIG